MFRTKLLFICGSLTLATLFGWASLNAMVVQQQEQEQQRVKKVTRAKRPQFNERDTDGIFFDDVFKDALVGDRPAVQAGSAKAGNAVAGNSDAGAAGGAGGSWSAFISGDVIETEIKSLQKDLVTQVTSPTKYKVEYKKARYSFSMLSMMFGIVLEHDEDVRWKRTANLALPSFVTAAKNARRGDSDSYKYAVARRDDLQELVRGGNMASQEKPIESFVWGDVVARSPIMVRLQNSVDRMKPLLASEAEFKANVETLYHEANMVAAMAEILAKESMDDASEEDYVEFARTMSAGATEIVESLKVNQYSGAETGFNQVNQSCSDCHDSWR